MSVQDLPTILVFDVFGTVVNWHETVSREVAELDLGVDPGEFALAWRRGYAPAMRKVNEDPEAWVVLDQLHRQILERVLQELQITHLNNDQKETLNRVWHRLDAWPDSVAGLSRLKTKFTICSLSNGNISLLTNMAKHAGLPWDCILSAESFKVYKPHPEAYLGVARTFDVIPERVMLVAAHQDDLDAARQCDLQTAYIERPFEFGAQNPKDVSGHPDNTFHASNIEQLADQLGC